MQNRLVVSALGLLALGQVTTAPSRAVEQKSEKSAPSAPASTAPAPATRVAKIVPTLPAAAPAEKRVSLDFVAADINDVLKALALQANVNIVTAADVKGNVTVSLNRVTVGEALDMVARLSGFYYGKVGSAYVVGTDKSVAALGASAPLEKPVEPTTEMIPYRFVRTADLGKALEARFPELRRALGDEKGEEKVNPSQPRMLVVTGPPVRVNEAKQFVAQLDQAATFPAAGTATEVYKVKYASSADLTTILSRLAPTVQVTLGPAQGFQSGSTGASASYAASGSGVGAEGGMANPAGAAGGAAGGGGTANPAGAVASGSAPTMLLLTGTPADIVRAREVLEQIDVRAPQMVFEARVLDINNQDLSKIGLTYDFSKNVFVGEAMPPGVTVDEKNWFARPLKFGAILRSPYDVRVNLDLLAQNNKARLLANPNISALDGQPAVVFIGDQIKYVIRQEVTPTGTNVQTETATVGITLKVTGKASPDGTVTLYVHPEVSVISGFLTAGGVSLPQIASRYVDTTIRVKDGETIAIGGLIRESDITNIQKVPLLGDLPFFGQLFRRTEKNKTRSEIVIFITSRILKD